MPSTSCPRPHIGIGVIILNPDGHILIGVAPAKDGAFFMGNGVTRLSADGRS